MRKIFTLIAGMLLVSSGAFAQKKWTNTVVKGDMEGEMPAYVTLGEMEEAGVLIEGKTWNSFWSHEFPKNEISEEQYQGTATIVEDPTNPSNHCARVIARSEAIADSCGNKVAADGKLASWDCQFFIYSTEPIPQGKLVRLTLKVRAEKAGSFETQAHWAPGDYNHYVMFGNVNVTTEWQTFVSDEVTVSADQSKEGDGKAFQSVAFNLSTNAEGNVFYFDDVKLEIKDDVVGPDPEDPGEWVNFLRKGTLSADKFGDFTTFTGRDGADGRDIQARIVEDPIDHQPALNVTTIAWNAIRVDTVYTYDINEETGDTLKDEKGKPIVISEDYNEVNIHIKENGDTLTAIDDWQTQFFVTIKHKFKSNQKFKVVMSARAARVDGEPLEDPVSIDTQAHEMPGQYKHWAFMGSPELTEDWQDFELGSDEEPLTVPSEANGCQTIALNCNKYKDHPINIYFRFQEFSFQEGVVLENERILASENITLPVGAKGNEDGVTVDVDMSELASTLEIDDLEKYLEGDILKVKTLDEDSVEVYTNEALQPATGFAIDQNGFYTEALNSLGLLIGEKIEGNKASFNMVNDGVELDNGISTKLLFTTKAGWYYLYNVQFISQEKYEEQLGISEMTTVKKNYNAIYNLMGRKVNKATKGLYIVNGKKVLF